MIVFVLEDPGHKIIEPAFNCFTLSGDKLHLY